MANWRRTNVIGIEYLVNINLIAIDLVRSNMIGSSGSVSIYVDTQNQASEKYASMTSSSL